MRTFEQDVANPPEDLIHALVKFACAEFSAIYVKYGTARAVRALRIKYEEMASE